MNQTCPSGELIRWGGVVTDLGFSPLLKESY